MSDQNQPPHKKQKLTHESHEQPLNSIKMQVADFKDLCLNMRLYTFNDSFKLYGQAKTPDLVCFSMINSNTNMNEYNYYGGYKTSDSNTNISDWNYYGEYKIFSEYILRKLGMSEYFIKKVSLRVFSSFITFKLHINHYGIFNFWLLRK